MQNYTRNEWGRCKTTLETSEEYAYLQAGSISVSTQKKLAEQINSGGTYSLIGLLRSYGNLQSYWTTKKLWKLTFVLDYYEAMETYGRIGLLRGYRNLQSYFIS